MNELELMLDFHLDGKRQGLDIIWSEGAVYIMDFILLKG